MLAEFQSLGLLAVLDSNPKIVLLNLFHSIQTVISKV